MTPATWPRPDALAERLLRIDPQTRRYRDLFFGELPDELRRGDLLVVNDAATLPASLAATSPSGRPVEVRLLRQSGPSDWDAVLFGEGDWRARTEDRPAPEPLEPGEAIVVGGELRAVVERVSPLSPRLVSLRFERAGAALWSALYRHGRPVQYSYLRGPLELWRVQTAYGARPWAAELPSAGRPLRWGLLRAIREKGVGLASLTHAAGLSSTGDAAIDAALPLPERYDIPERTAESVEATHAVGGRVVAVGTTVARRGRRRSERRLPRARYRRDRPQDRCRLSPADRGRPPHRPPRARDEPFRAPAGLRPAGSVAGGRLPRGDGRISRTRVRGLEPGPSGPTAQQKSASDRRTRLDKVATRSYLGAMRSVGLKTLKNRLSEYVRLAAGGETVLVTDRDRVVAELSPPRADRAVRLADALLAEAMRKGWIAAPLMVAEDPPPRVPVAPLAEILRELDQDRSDR